MARCAALVVVVVALAVGAPHTWCDLLQRCGEALKAEPAEGIDGAQLLEAAGQARQQAMAGEMLCAKTWRAALAKGRLPKACL